MSDIVTRLRTGLYGTHPIIEEAATEIERLRAAPPPTGAASIETAKQEGRQQAGRALIGVADWLLHDPESDVVDGHVSAVLRELGDKLINMTSDDLIVEGLTGMAADLRKVVPFDRSQEAVPPTGAASRATIERAAWIMEQHMFADHELPLEADLHAKYLRMAEVVAETFATSQEATEQKK